MNTFDDFNEVYVPMFERNCEDWMFSIGCYSPEIYLSDATEQNALDWIKRKDGKLGCGYVVKLKEVDPSLAGDCDFLIVLTERDSEHSNSDSILWEKIGNNNNQIFKNFSSLKHEKYGRLKFLTVDSFKKAGE